MISTQWMRRTPSVGPSSSSRKGIALLHSSISAAARVRNSAGDTVQRTASPRSEEHTSELQSLMRISYAVFCLKKKKKTHKKTRSNRKNTIHNQQKHSKIKLEEN